jgi:hypothetical protein
VQVPCLYPTTLLDNLTRNGTIQNDIGPYCERVVPVVLEHNGDNRGFGPVLGVAIPSIILLVTTGSEKSLLPTSRHFSR